LAQPAKPAQWAVFASKLPPNSGERADGLIVWNQPSLTFNSASNFVTSVLRSLKPGTTAAFSGLAGHRQGKGTALRPDLERAPIAEGQDRLPRPVA
jgi:hypothetical protein